MVLGARGETAEDMVYLSLLLGRSRSGGGVAGVRGAVELELLDGGALLQAVDDLGDVGLRQFLANLTLGLVEGRRGSHAAVIDLDDVVAELGLDRGHGGL